MFLQRLAHYLKARWRPRPSGTPRRRPACRLCLEPLEDRLVLSTYLQANLAADQPGVALVQDPDLTAAWGISLNPNGGAFWLSSVRPADSQTASATNVSPLYNGDLTRTDGTFVPFTKNPLTVVIPGGGAPTGQVFSGSLTDFRVSSGTANQPAR